MSSRHIAWELSEPLWAPLCDALDTRLRSSSSIGEGFFGLLKKFIIDLNREGEVVEAFLFFFAFEERARRP